MAKPKTPIVLELDADQLTADEMCLFEPSGFSMSGLCNFIAKYSSWTREEVGKLTMTELNEVAEALSKQVDELAVPLVNDAS